ncbi:MAG: hypothetical protein JO141_22100 [Bradyrhizobium sp.]|nr:hypothetical protein [Bradyrhizobium sp.]
MGTDARIKSAVPRRCFNSASLLSLAVTAAGSLPGPAAAQSIPAGNASTRRDVVTQSLPGDPQQDITLVEVTYPPGARSPPHMDVNGVMAFVVAGTIVSKLGDGPDLVKPIRDGK